MSKIKKKGGGLINKKKGFHSDFVALGQNQTRNFVARHKLGFDAISSLCLRIELVGVWVRVRARVRIPRQIRHSSDAAPAQTCHKIRHRSATKSATDPAQRVRNDPLHTTVAQADRITFKFAKDEKYFVKRRERLKLLCGTPDIVLRHTGCGD